MVNIYNLQLKNYQSSLQQLTALQKEYEQLKIEKQKLIAQQDSILSVIEKEIKMVVAESCTGGLISHRITNIPGSSEYYLGGVCVYSNSAKRSLLRVKPETLEKYGAVSQFWNDQLN